MITIDNEENHNENNQESFTDPYEALSNNNPLIEESNDSQVLKQLLNDDAVPEEIKKKFWFVFHNDNSLTFLDDKRMAQNLLNFDIIKLDLINSMPYYDYDFNIESTLNILRQVYETKLNRSLGSSQANQKNERIVQQSQFAELRQYADSPEGSANKGILQRMLGMRGK